jgi:osmotically inducible protein OsmC
MQSKASAVWNGGLKDGSGKVSTDSKVLADVAYTFASRFEKREGTSPEELIAAAHASCFSMAFSGDLGAAGMKPESIRTTATVTLGKTDAGATIVSSHLETVARVPGADEQRFQQAAEKAKAGCPVSRLLNTEITLSAKLER